MNSISAFDQFGYPSRSSNAALRPISVGATEPLVQKDPSWGRRAFAHPYTDEFRRVTRSDHVIHRVAAAPTDTYDLITASCVSIMSSFSQPF
jgi:hypothetical protein